MRNLQLVPNPEQASGPFKGGVASSRGASLVRLPRSALVAVVEEVESPRKLALSGAHFLSHLFRAFQRVESVETQAVDTRALEQLFERFRPASEAERARWAQYLVSVSADQGRPEVQRAAILDVWQRIIEREPAVMYPTSGFDEDRTFYFGWNPPGRTLDVQIGANGEVSWLFADHTTKFGASSDEHDPQAFLTFLSSFRRRA